MALSHNATTILKALVFGLALAAGGFAMVRFQAYPAPQPLHSPNGPAYQPNPPAIYPADGAARTDAAAAPRDAAPPGAIAGPARALDAHTLRVGGEVVMLFGIRVPAEGAGCVAGDGPWDCYSPARRALQALVDGRQVSCLPKARLGNGVWVGRCSVGKEDVAGALLRQGWGVYDRTSSTRLHAWEYAANESLARDEHRGVWIGRVPADQWVPYPGAY